MTDSLSRTLLENLGRDLYIKSLAVWMSPSMKLARTFAEMKDIPQDILKNAEDIYESQFKDLVERKTEERIKFERRMRQLYPDKNVLRPRVPNSILVS